MGNDYNLKKIYEQMIKNEVPATKNDQPKTLKEAYEKKLVVERTAFFAKTFTGNQPVSISDPDAIPLGAIEDTEAKQIKNTIRSHAISTVTDELLTKAGWEANNPVLNSRNLGIAILDEEVDLDDLNTISKYKQYLNLINPDKQKDRFNIIEKLTTGIENLFQQAKKELKTPVKNLEGLIQVLFEKTGTIDGTNIGPGEIVLSLLTDATKAEKGDLNLAGKLVEIKAAKSGEEKGKISGAALGYAKYAEGGALRNKMLAVLTKEYQSDRALYKGVKAYIESFIENLKRVSVPVAGEDSFFTETFFKELENLVPILVNKEPEKFTKQVTDKLHFSLDSTFNKEKELQRLIPIYTKLGYFNSRLVNNEPKTLDLLKQLISNVREKLKEVRAKSSSLKGSSSNSSSKNAELVQEISKESSLTVSLKDLFLWSNFTQREDTDGDLSKNLADVLFEARPYKECASSLHEEILKALRGGYTSRLQKHDTKALDGLMFAVHLSEYAAHEGFQYLLAINRTTKNALFIPVSEGFTSLLNFYNTHSSYLNFIIVFENRQGAHKITVV